ncbi:MAG: hypothetical protein SFX73_37295 [Kofleriaceae bacterium]|nr:hypothetical protein [Kofleriaceae bacterium]
MAVAVAVVWKLVAALAWLVAGHTSVWTFKNPDSRPVFVTVEVADKQVLMRTALLPWQTAELHIDTAEDDIRVSASFDGRRWHVTDQYNAGSGFDDCFVVAGARSTGCPASTGD